MRTDLTEEPSANFAHYRDVVRRRRIYLVVAPLLCALVAFFVASRDDEVYRASALLRVESETIDTDVELLTTSVLYEAVAERLGADFAEVRDVSATRVGETQLVSISVTSTSSEVAADAANEWAAAYRQQRNEDFAAELREERDQLLQGAADLSPEIVSVQAEMGVLEEAIADADDASDERLRLAQLQTDLVRLESQQRDLNERALSIDAQLFDIARTVELADRAAAPRGPISPQPVRSAAVGLFVGLLLGAVAAALAELFDDPIWDEEDAERWSGGVPVIATIPTAPTPSRRAGIRPVTLSDSGHPVSEAYRVLRTSIQYQGLEGPVNRIMVTSPEAGEGKTVTSVNLAITFAKAGMQVALVDADLRLGAVGRTVGLSVRGGGLEKVVGSSFPVRDALIDLPGCSPGALDVILAGEVPHNPSELVGSDRMREVLDELARSHDTVIVDTPPMLAVSDSLIMARYVDGVVVVVRSRRTRGRALKQAIERIEQSGVRVLGLILNDDRRRLQTSVYRYTRSHPEELPEPRPLHGLGG